MDARFKYLQTPDGVGLYYELCLPDRPKANIIFIHGLGDHIGRYPEFVRYMVRHGYGVCMYDQRGHGRSGGRRAHCRSFNDFLKDLSQMVDMVQKAGPHTPLFLAGHSFGGGVAINFAGRYSKGLRGIIALSPNIEPLVKIPAWKKRLAAKISKIFPIAKFYTKIEPSQFSHDEKVVEAAGSDPLMNWHVTARLGTEILDNLAQMPRLAFHVKVPALFMHGSDDTICSVEATRKFYHSLLIQNKDLKIYPGLYHELLNETSRERVFSDMQKWLDSQVAAYKRLAGAGGEEQHYASNQTPDLWHYSNGLDQHRAG